MKKDVVIVLLIVFIVTLSCLPLFKNIHNINPHIDWLQMLSYYHLDRQSILQYHQIPLWTPYFGGGYPLIANPLDGSLNPFFLPVLIFGEVIGLKINVFLAHIIGALGMYYLTRHVLGYNQLGSFFSSIIFCFGGNLHRLLIKGATYPPIYCFFLPFLLGFFIKAKDNKKYIIYSIFLLTFIMTQASLRFAVILLFLFLFSILETMQYKNNKFSLDMGWVKNLMIILFFTFLLGAVKLLPMLELLEENLRVARGYVRFLGPLSDIYKSFFMHQQNHASIGHHWNYLYLGYIPVIFMLSAFIIYWRKTWRYFVLLAIFIFLSFSAHRQLDLFKLLWQLPIFHSIESPSRYFIPLVIFIVALIAGRLPLFGTKKKFITPILILLVAISTIDLFYTNGSKEESFPLAVPQYTKQQSFFSVKNSNPANNVSSLVPRRIFMTRAWEWAWPTQYELILTNIGKINAYTNIHLGEYAKPKYYIDWNTEESFDPKNYTWRLNPDYKGEIYFLNNPNNKAEFQYFSPNKLIAKVTVSEPDTLVINQNYDKYWKSSPSKPIAHNNLLALKLDKTGEYLINFNYVPVSFYVGLGVSIFTLLMILCYLRIII